MLLTCERGLLSSAVPPEDPWRRRCCLLPIPTQSNTGRCTAHNRHRITGLSYSAAKLMAPPLESMRSDEPFDPQTRLLTSDGSQWQWLARQPNQPGDKQPCRRPPPPPQRCPCPGRPLSFGSMSFLLLDFISSLDMIWFGQGIPFSSFSGREADRLRSFQIPKGRNHRNSAEFWRNAGKTFPTLSYSTVKVSA